MTREETPEKKKRTTGIKAYSAPLLTAKQASISGKGRKIWLLSADESPIKWVSIDDASAPLCKSLVRGMMHIRRAPCPASGAKLLRFTRKRRKKCLVCASFRRHLPYVTRHTSHRICKGIPAFQTGKENSHHYIRGVILHLLHC